MRLPCLRADFSGQRQAELRAAAPRKRDVPPTVYSGTQNNLPEPKKFGETSHVRRLALPRHPLNLSVIKERLLCEILTQGVGMGIQRNP